MRRKRLSRLERHLEWLDGRMPSEAIRDCERDFSTAPIAQYVAQREAAGAMRTVYQQWSARRTRSKRRLGASHV